MPPIRDILPWAAAVLLVLLMAIIVIWLNQPPQNTLPNDYGVM